MAPKYPSNRAAPASTSANDPPVVVSASARATPTPSLAPNSPSKLRSRASPRNPLAAFDGPSNLLYPSPAGALSKVRAKLGGGRKAEDTSGLEWVPLSSNGDETPRASPVKGKARDDGLVGGQETSGGGRGHSLGRMRNVSAVSVASSTGAGGDQETSRFLTPQRANVYPPRPGLSVHTNASSASIDYSLASPSYSLASPSYSLAGPSSATSSTFPSYSPQAAHSPYGPYESLAGPPGSQSTIFHHAARESLTSLNSMTHFRARDALAMNYADISITSKGGKRHLDEMFALPADPASWLALGPEDDDDLHDPEIKHYSRTGFWRAMLTTRGAGNVGCLALIFVILVTLFAGYPIISEYIQPISSNLGAYNLGGINASGQLPDVGPFQLIDKDTPESAYTFTSLETGDQWELVFSDEFNNPGRTFYDGDDPYWEAVDLHYWQTNNLEWYDPSHLQTKDGHLVVTLNNKPKNGMNYTGGMMSTWNRFCFTGGYIEVSLPGTSSVYGLWPAIWTMGNLGRAGYGGSLDGMWPYSYDSCDVGTVKNQSINGVPALTLTDGDPSYNNVMSYLPGQRLSRCTCTGDANHPGPALANGTFVGRAAPEIDMFEATVDSTLLEGFVSQSGQWAPFNPHYYFINESNADYEVYDSDMTTINTYLGGVYQQATSGLSLTDQNCYTGGTGCYSTYGFEYEPGDDGYITWVAQNKKSWTIRAAAMAPNTAAGVGQRVVSTEPMYLIVNLGLSENFGAIDYDGLESLWPVEMHVDYIRVYQDPNNKNIGCDPADRPTAAYIASLSDAYYNPNITVFDEIPNAVRPKNNLVDSC